VSRDVGADHGGPIGEHTLNVEPFVPATVTDEVADEVRHGHRVVAVGSSAGR
jgi:hypothetical protein